MAENGNFGDFVARARYLSKESQESKLYDSLHKYKCCNVVTFRKDIPAAHLDSPVPASQTALASGSEMKKIVIENILRRKRGEHFNFFVFSLKTVCD